MNKILFDIYKSKIKNIEDALKLIKSDDFIVTSLGGGEPQVLLNNLHKLKNYGIKNCELTNCLSLNNYEFISNPDYKENIFVTGWFYSPALRHAHKNGNVSFLPQHAHAFVNERFYAVGNRRIVLLCSCSSVDNHGYVSLSLSSFYERDLINNGAIVIAEINPNLPRTFGDTIVSINEINALVEVDYYPPTLPETPISDKDRCIGEYIGDLIEDGSTIQLGIGKIPNAVTEVLKFKHNLGIHTEMFTDNMANLINCGAVNNSSKTLYRGKSVCSFTLGSKNLYKFLDDNPSIIFKSASWTNNPSVIAQNHKMTSINTTLEIDLTGQCASESIGHVQYSGTGGQADTAIGAKMSDGGKSIIALYSTIEKKDSNGEIRQLSKIVPFLKTGSTVSLSRNDVDYVVTEYGVAWLRGKSIRERVKELINIAHPNFRDKLRFDAKKYMIW